MPSTIEMPEVDVEEAVDYKLRYQPPYHVILINDDDHSYAYVITMLQELFGYEVEKGFLLADEVDKTGRAIVLTTTREHAELKQEQIHAYGADPFLERSSGSMTAVIEPAE
jgi:ATP-dependent Clp protease adaptor protein ClpS